MCSTAPSAQVVRRQIMHLSTSEFSPYVRCADYETIIAADIGALRIPIRSTHGEGDL